MYKRRYLHKERKLRTSRIVFLVFVLVLLLISFLLLFRRAKEKRVLFVSEAKDAFYLVNVDLSRRELVLINIPKNTQVEVSYNLGQWEIGSVWKLGEQEKIGGGKLLVDTIRKNFFVPVYLWMPYQERIFTDVSFFSRLRYFIFSPTSNVKIGLRLRLLWVSFFGFKEINRVDLAKTRMLEKTVLKTGKDGFLIKDDLPDDLRIYLNDPSLGGVFLSVINESGNSIIVGEIGKVVETMGGKLISVENENSSDTDCLIYSSNLHFARIFSSVFACDISRSIPFSLSDNEVVIRIGKKFSARW